MTLYGQTCQKHCRKQKHPNLKGRRVSCAFERRFFRDSSGKLEEQRCSTDHPLRLHPPPRRSQSPAHVFITGVQADLHEVFFTRQYPPPAFARPSGSPSTAAQPPLSTGSVLRSGCSTTRSRWRSGGYSDAARAPGRAVSLACRMPRWRISDGSKAPSATCPRSAALRPSASSSPSRPGSLRRCARRCARSRSPRSRRSPAGCRCARSPGTS